VAALTDKAARLLQEANFGNLATIRGDGTPHVTPVWVDYDGESVLINTAVGRTKERHLRRDPRATVEVFDRNNPYSYVSVSGTAEMTREGADEHINKLAKKYFGLDEYPSRQPGEQRVLVRIRPDRVNESIKD
jgi:PPOX class probable F420-dependent enzyme